MAAKKKPQATFGWFGGSSIGSDLLAGIPPRAGTVARPPVTADVVVYERDGPRHIDGWLTDDAPTITAGYGGWQTQPRPRRPALTTWQGRDPFQLTIPLLLYRGGRSVGNDLHDIDIMSSGTPNGEPPIVGVFGAIMMPVHAGADWVVQDVSWGEQVRRPSDWAITRQLVTLTLLEYVDDRLLAASTLSDRRGRKTVVRHYTVRKGDTLRSIAARELHDARRWTDIAVLNGLRSSGQLKRGRQIKLP